MSDLVRAVRRLHQPRPTVAAFGAPPAKCSCGEEIPDYIDHLGDEIAETAYQQGYEKGKSDGH